MAYYFTQALGIPALSRTKQQLHQDELALSECDEDLDVDISMDIDVWNTMVREFGGFKH